MSGTIQNKNMLQPSCMEVEKSHLKKNLTNISATNTKNQNNTKQLP